MISALANQRTCYVATWSWSEVPSLKVGRHPQRADSPPGLSPHPNSYIRLRRALRSCRQHRTTHYIVKDANTMANIMGGGDGMMGGFPLEQWFYEMPVCTRWWMTAALSASVLVQCHVISPFQLFYSVRTVFFKSQVRPATYFLVYPLIGDLVLATCNDVLLLWAIKSRPPLPYILPPALFAPTRRVVRTLARPLLMAFNICFFTATLHCAHVLHGFFGIRSQQHPHIHLE